MQATDLEERLKAAFPEAELMVTDLTGGGSNFEVRIIASQFEGKSRIEQHQAVMGVFDAELKSGELHALTLKTLAK
ncbi:MAG: BolA family transcriptional regulator [Bdellovibrionales bacterium]|nr:BolA family transcriptional regulator [Bdellovibrionales bacterium]